MPLTLLPVEARLRNTLEDDNQLDEDEHREDKQLDERGNRSLNKEKFTGYKS